MNYPPLPNNVLEVVRNPENYTNSDWISAKRDEMYKREFIAKESWELERLLHGNIASLPQHRHAMNSLVGWCFARRTVNGVVLYRLLDVDVS